MYFKLLNIFLRKRRRPWV